MECRDSNGPAVPPHNESRLIRPSRAIIFELYSTGTCGKRLRAKESYSTVTTVGALCPATGPNSGAATRAAFSLSPSSSSTLCRRPCWLVGHMSSTILFPVVPLFPADVFYWMYCTAATPLESCFFKTPNQNFPLFPRISTSSLAPLHTGSNRNQFSTKSIQSTVLHILL